MQVTYIPISKLKLNDKNPRKIDKDQFEKLCRNIETDPEYFAMRPCLVNQTEQGNIVYAGNQRLRAAKKLGMKEVPCIVTNDVPENLLKRRVVLDNITHGEHDFDLLASLYDPIELLELGMKEHELHLDGATLIEGDAEDETEVLEPGRDEDAETKPGDVYELNEHRIICGSATEFSVFEKLVNSKNVDLIITDPPYNVDYTGKTKDKLKIQNDSMSNDKFYDFLLEMFKNTFAVLNEGCSIYVFHADIEGINFRSSFKNAGFKLSQCLVWAKNSLVMGRSDYHWKHEPILYGWKEGQKHKWFSDRQQTTVLEFDRPTKSEDHPTMKPVLLFNYLMKNSSRENEIVLDPFLGSGTTLIAAEQLSRICYGVELSPAYVDIIINRWKNYMKKNKRLFKIIKNGEIQDENN